MKKLIVSAMTLVLVPVLAACNTVAGIGKDVRATGKVLEETAQDVKEEITN